MNTAHILIECLLEQGVDTVFGYPGATILKIYDALCDYEGRLRHVLTSHEQDAAHAADGYARSTGRTGVCFATSGPGATNLVTGIAAAHMDSSPVVFITCNVAESLIGRDAFQEVDITGISMPITKCNYLVRDPARLADVVREAFAIAASGRPGPVLIDIARNVTEQETEYTPLPKKEHLAHGSLRYLLRREGQEFQIKEPDAADISLALTMLSRAERPLILAGGGVIRADAADELLRFARLCDTPVVTTLMGLGAISGDDPLFAGMLGMHGSHMANRAAQACDLLIAVGTRFSDRVIGTSGGFCRNAKILQLDIDRSEVDKNLRTDHHVIGDARLLLSRLNGALSQQTHGAWREAVRDMARESPPAPNGALQPKDVFAAARARAGDAIVTTDVGQHQMWCAQHFCFLRPRQLITSGGFGAMGFGLGAAVGAALGNPGRTVLHITGDGSFRMNAKEMGTVRRLSLPVLTILFNNRTLGMVRQWQTISCGGRYSQTALDDTPDFLKLAEAYGIPGRRIASAAEFDDALARALEAGGPHLIECRIDTDELVRPLLSPSGVSDYLVE